MSDIWLECNGANHITPIHEIAWRMESSHEGTSIRKLVDSYEEQEVLEELIESTKLDFHSFLLNPFRVPPLKYGSRFGTRFEPSLWYGSLNMDAVMAEKEFYQFNFLRASKASFGLVSVKFTAFSVVIKTMRGIKLTQVPFDKYSDRISSPTSYEDSQSLGTAMRQAGIAAFNYQSARDPDRGINIALFTPNAFLHKNPNSKSFQTWQCTIENDRAEFIHATPIAREIKKFSIDAFLVDKKLPFPAN